MRPAAGEASAAAVGRRRPARRLRGGPGDCDPPCPLQPVGDVELEPGVHVFSAIDIPAGVTVRAPGALVLHVTGPVDVAGTLAADCGALEVHALGEVAITGTLDNRCSGDAAGTGGLVIHTEGGNRITLGTPDMRALLLSSGGLDVSNDSTLATWEFDVPPFQRSASQLAPVCSVHASPVAGPAVEGVPFAVRFEGRGADPDGGPVGYLWDFGDGGTSTEQEPDHEYAELASYDVTLTVSDDDGESCVATARVTNVEGGLAVALRPALLVVEVGEPLPLTAYGSGGADYSWDLGDGSQAGGEQIEHVYAAPGRYEVTVEAAAGASSAEASAVVWVYPTPSPLSPPVSSSASDPLGAALSSVALYLNIDYRPGRSQTGKGSDAIFKGWFTVEVEAGSIIEAQGGRDASDVTGQSLAVGADGGDGGALDLLSRGSLTIGAGVVLAAGDGGCGASASATSPAGTAATAHGGRGGHGGMLTLSSLLPVFLGPPGARTLLRAGDGGAGGDATAAAMDDARTGCLLPAPTASKVTARAGGGGDAFGLFVMPAPTLGGNVLVRGARGGVGGDARATGGSGSNSSCLGSAEGGTGDHASAFGGSGGWSFPSPSYGLPVDLPSAYAGGQGGVAYALGGRGGNAVSAPVDACSDAGAVGGKGGLSSATGGKGGLGNPQVPGAVSAPAGGGGADAGDGGGADATGSECYSCNQGGSASAKGGDGGDADAPSLSVGGAGGNAAARGGAGGDCTVCPGGAGGPGGYVTASGGSGGNGSGGGAVAQGMGGSAEGTGGDAGDGATCCGPPDEPGGAGGEGGLALAIPGPGRSWGDATSAGGDGGDGGDGSPPGALGPGGPADTKGIDGMPGGPCPPTALEVGAARLPVEDAANQSPSGWSPGAGGSWVFTSGGLTFHRTLSQEPGQIAPSGPALQRSLAAQPARQVVLPAIEPFDVVELEDGSVIVAGRTFTTFCGWIGRLLADGTLAWQTTVTQAKSFRRIALVDATTLVAAFEDIASSQVHVARVSTSGVVLSTTRLASPASSLVRALLPLADGGYLLAFNIGFTSTSDAVVIRFGSGGAITWQARFGGVSLVSLLEAAGDLFLVGSYRPPAASTNDGWVARLAANGSVIWQRTYGQTGLVVLNRLMAAPGGLIAFGRANPGNETRLIQLADDGAVVGVRGYGANGGALGAGLTGEGGVAMGMHSFSTGYTVIATAPDLTLPGCSNPALGAVVSPDAIPSAPAAAVLSIPAIAASTVASTTAAISAVPVSKSAVPTDLCASP